MATSDAARFQDHNCFSKRSNPRSRGTSQSADRDGNEISRAFSASAVQYMPCSCFRLLPGRENTSSLLYAHFENSRHSQNRPLYPRRTKIKST
ncbi:hypothetical protein NDU88_003710 [Pleurodeles waltl]|uniref:Uncharacterized protein n=1 Tax=Pleurodeles waltl TaxID=8319 RepID=A0AAV7UF12_PLEWA|nr:hypothetical protein NDU88_003710 [Pleurodeles waltl]